MTEQPGLRRVVVLLQYHLEVGVVHQVGVLNPVEAVQHERGLFPVKAIGT